MFLNDSQRRLVRRIVLALLCVATAVSLASLPQTAKADTVCAWDYEDYIYDPVTGQLCGYHNNCTEQQTGCHGNDYIYVTHTITCPLGCCKVGCSL